MGDGRDDEPEELRLERGEQPRPGLPERLKELPLVPHSVGMVGVPLADEEETSAEADRRAAEERARKR